MAAALAAGAVAWVNLNHAQGQTDRARAARRFDQVDTAHYTLLSDASPEQTRRIAQAAEALYAAYSKVFAGSLPETSVQPRLQLMLYRSRGEFKANNRSSPWAEAFYQWPRSHAYYAEGSPNPYHWMVHEATHQLNYERAHLRLPRWINEGLATYFGTSRLEHGVLHPGEIDRNTYPAWWLPQLWLTGNLEDDVARGRLIPIRALITDTGPDINTNVNLYYIEYWSLAHFLLEHDRARHAAGFRMLMKTDGSLLEFERLIGPVDRVQAEWYSHLMRLRATLAAGAASRSPARP